MNSLKRVGNLVARAGRVGLKPTLKALESALSPINPAIKLVATDWGRFYVIENDYLSEHLSSGENHEPHFHEVSRFVLRPSDNVIDLGANLGAHTVWMSRLVPNGRVHSFEPLSLTYSQLQLTVLENQLRNVDTFKLAVSDRTAQLVRMQQINYAADDLNIGSTRVSDIGSGDATLTVRLDDLQLPPIRFIKIDIQGSEYVALLGMSELLRRDRPVLFIEIEEALLRECGTSSKQVMEHLLSMDYTLFRIRTKYPCDHVAVPTEALAEFEPRLLDGSLGFAVDKIQGRRIELTFEDNAYTYSKVRVL